MQKGLILRGFICRGALVAGLLAVISTPAVRAQGTQIPQGVNSQNWFTANADAERDSWVRMDPEISVESISKQKDSFGVVRKSKLDIPAATWNVVSQPTMEASAGGYKSMGYLIDNAGNAVGFDSDTGQIFWKTPLRSDAEQPASCATSINGGTARMMDKLLPETLPFGGIELGFRVRDRQPPAGGAVSEPHQGAPNINDAVVPNSGPRGPGFRAPGGGVYAIGPDGMLHELSELKGFDTAMAPVKFVPPGAATVGLIGYDKFLYVATAHSCSGVPNGVWAMNLDGNKVVSWTTNGADIAGTAGPAIGTIDATLFVATGASASGSDADANSVIALDPKTLKVKDSLRADAPFVSSPVVIANGVVDRLAVAGADGRLFLLDGISLGGADHKTPMAVSAKFTDYTSYTPGALASWQDADGTRWILAPMSGAIASGAHFSAANGKVTNGAVVAFKVVDRGGKVSLEPGWASRDMVSPLPPMVINGVVFVVAGGEYRPGDKNVTDADRAQHSQPAVLYALDGKTGKEIWSSGSTLTSPARSIGLSSLFSTVYLVTSDNVLWQFGLPQYKE